MSDLSSIILAGGRSRRMGQDKALLTLPDGQPLLQRTAQIAQQLASETLVVTPWPERYQAVLPSTVRLVKEQTAAETTTGPLGGFAQGLSQVRSDWCLLLACDLPYLEQAALQRWWHWLMTDPCLDQPLSAQRLTEANPNSAPMMASLAPGIKGWEPLCGYYHRSCLPGLHSHAVQRDRSFQSWLATIPIATYRALPAAMLFNCNTPHDWAAIK